MSMKQEARQMIMPVITILTGFGGLIFFFPVYAGAFLHGYILSDYPNLTIPNDPAILSPFQDFVVLISTLISFIAFFASFLSVIFGYLLFFKKMRKLCYLSASLILFVSVYQIFVAAVLAISNPPHAFGQITTMFVLWHLPLIIFVLFNIKLMFWIRGQT